MSHHEHTKFTSSAGAVLAAVGSAVGMGNIWLFPYRVGQYGGGAFLLLSSLPNGRRSLPSAP